MYVLERKINFTIKLFNLIGMNFNIQAEKKYAKRIESMKVKKITAAAIIAAVYAAISLVLSPISFGIIQCRVSEALTIMPLIMPEAVPGLFIGCLLANLISGAVWYDVVFGSLATLVAAFLTYKSKNKWVGATYPVVVNAIIVGVYLGIFYNLPVFYAIICVAIGQAIACYGIGIPLLVYIQKKFNLKNRTF